MFIVSTMWQDMVKQFAASLLFDALMLSGNKGMVPPKFREISNEITANWHDLFAVLYISSKLYQTRIHDLYVYVKYNDLQT
jgi:hypothetical protein